MKEIPIGLIGFGTIGTGVVKLLRQNEVSPMRFIVVVSLKYIMDKSDPKG